MGCNKKFFTLIILVLFISLMCVNVIAFNQSDINTDLILYYPTYTGSGTKLIDESGNDLNASFAGDPTWNNTVFKIEGYSVLVDGATDSFTIADNSKFDNLGEFTVTSWIYGIGTDAEKFQFWQDGMMAISPHYNSATTAVIATVWNPTQYNTICYAPLVKAGSWNMIATTYNGSKVRIFINGTECTNYNAQPVVTGNLSGTNPFTIGCAQGGSACINGNFDDTRFYRKALTLTAVADIWNNTYGNIRPYDIAVIVTGPTNQSILLENVTNISITQISAIVLADSNVTGNSKVRINGLEFTNASNTKHHRVSLTGLSSSTNYLGNITVYATDNISTFANVSINFTTLPGANKSIAIYSPRNESVTTNSTILKVDTNITTNVSFLLNGVEYNSSSFTKNHSLLITGLSPHMVYYWNLTAYAQDDQTTLQFNGTFNFMTLNSIPIINSVTITPSPLAETIDDLIGYCNASDADDDNVTYFWTWYKDDIIYKQMIFMLYSENGQGIHQLGGIPQWTNINNAFDGDWGGVGATCGVSDCAVEYNHSSSEAVKNATYKIGLFINGNQPGASPEYDFYCGGGVSTQIFSMSDEAGSGSIIVSGNVPAECLGGDYIEFALRYDRNGGLETGIFMEENISYIYEYYIESENINVDNISNLETESFENWTLECFAYDGYDNSSVINSSDIKIFAVPNITQIYITPINPEYDDNLNCNVVGEQEGDGNLSINITWYNSTDNITWVHDIAFDYTYVNIIKGNLITTEIGTGSKPKNQDNYTYWKCEATITDGTYYNSSNSSFASIYPLENLTIYEPNDDKLSKNPLNATFSVVDLDNNINCTLNIYNSSIYQTFKYQEIANFTKFTNVLANESYINDSDWDTFGVGDSSGSEIFLNYSKPVLSSLAIWRLKGGNLTPIEENITIPDICFDAYSDSILLKIETEELCLPCFDYVKYYCNNGGGWNLINTIRTEPNGLRVYDNSIYWQNKVIIDIINLTNLESGVIHTINYTPSYDGVYNWNIDCIAPSFQNVSIESSERKYTYDTHPITYSDFSDNQNSMYPEIDDYITLNVSLTDNYLIDTCRLMINDTGEWANMSSYVINVNNSYYLSMQYQIKNYSTANNSNIYWSVWCEDGAGNINTSIQHNFTVKDVTLPHIQLGNNSFINNSIISGALYNASLNVLFFDYNLFQTSINITCDINGSIFYWEDLDLNKTSYEFNASISLLNYPLQKCEMFTQSSDDHTANKIPEYDITKSDNKGLNINTEHGTNIILESTSVDERGKIKLDKVDTVKLDDRYSFIFKFKDKSKQQNFTLKSNMPIYYRKDSDYVGHFVIWNTDNNYGNWLDFVIKDKQKDEYNITVNKINNTFYNILLVVDEEIDEIEFESIGGTNVENATFAFYIGGAVTLNLTNIYDDTYFKNFTVNVTTIDSYPGWNGSALITGYGDVLENVSNGTYDITFSGLMFPQTYRINITNQTSSLMGYSYNSILNLWVRNVATLNNIIDLNISVDNLNTGKINLENTTTVALSTFYLNASDYQINVSKNLYIDASVLQTLNYVEEVNLTIDMGFYANVSLYDERTWGLFNISGADRVEFLIWCTDESTNITILNETSTMIPIMCPYTKFQISVLEGDDDYYRTYLINASELVSFKAYLIDLQTTPAVYTSLIIDDLLNAYENIEIWVYKNIAGSKVPITADNIDMENKIGAYLIENDQYIIEIHSSNLPDRNMGFYAADVGGDKLIRLYDINIPTETDTLFADTSFSMGTTYINISGENTTYAFLYYEDEKNMTESVTFNIYQDAYSGVPIYSQTSTSGSVTFEENITNLINYTLYGELIITYDDINYTKTQLLNYDGRVFLGLNEYVSQGFLNWFFLLFLGTLAMMATIQTANYTGMFMIGLAGLLVLFGWFQLSIGILGLSLLFSILSLFKEVDKGGLQ